MEDSAAESVGYAIGSVLPFAVVAALAYAAWSSSTWEARFVRALDAGHRRKARRLLDRNAKARPRPRRLPGHKQRMQRSRLLGLWLLGELDELRAELARHTGLGSASYLGNVRMFGVLAIATEAAGDELEQRVAELDALAAKVTQESTRLLQRTRELAASVARVGGGLAGRPIDDADAAAFQGHSFGGSPLMRIVMLRVLVLVADRAGRPGLRFQRTLAGLTRRFAPAPDVAA